MGEEGKTLEESEERKRVGKMRANIGKKTGSDETIREGKKSGKRRENMRRK